jgi:hypothetical protein
VTVGSKVIERLRAVLKPRRERFNLAVVMEKWVALVNDEEPEHGRVGPAEFAWCGPDDPVEGLAGPPSPRPTFQRPKRGRHPADFYSALMLAVIFQEYTGEPPTRKWNARKKLETSRFYQFAEVAFGELLHRTPPWSALHETCERWPRSRDFSKRAMQQQLFGGLVPKK